MLVRVQRKGKTSPFLARLQTCTITLEVNMADFQKIGNNSISRLNFTTPGIYPKDISPYLKGTCSTMFIVALFLLARNWKQLMCPSTEEWIKII